MRMSCVMPKAHANSAMDDGGYLALERLEKRAKAVGVDIGAGSLEDCGHIGAGGGCLSAEGGEQVCGDVLHGAVQREEAGEQPSRIILYNFLLSFLKQKRKCNFGLAFQSHCKGESGEPL